MLVIFPDVTRNKIQDNATLYRADRTHYRSQEHQQDKDSKVETHAIKGRSKGNEAMAAPSDERSLCSSGDETFLIKDSTSSMADDITNEGDTKAVTTISRSSTDKSTLSCSSTDEITTSHSSTDGSTPSGSSSTDERRPCSQLQLLLASASSTPLISKDLNDACRPEITDIAVVLNGVKPDDGPSAATGHHAHADLLPMATARCQAHGPSSSLSQVQT